MCLLAVQYRLVPESPILVAANREEYFDRPSLTPSIQSGKPRILCGIDQKAGGTWLGVNQNGLFVGVCNRVTNRPLFGQRSRGLLALDLLRCTSAEKALDRAHSEFAKTRYEGCNILIADAQDGYCIHADERQEVLPLRDGLNIIGARNLEQLESNIGASGWSLDEDQMARLTEAGATELPYPYSHISGAAERR